MKEIKTKLEPQIKYEGTIRLVDFDIPCYILEDGKRLLSSMAMQNALNLQDDYESNKSGTRLARYLGQKSLEPYIYKDKEVGHYNPIVCYKGDQKINGYEATILADICDAFLDARNNIPLSSRQKIIADQCEILIRAFARVGIIALVDEATGYQYERERFELQKILKTYISEEILEWQKTFHDSFYKEIFRLKKIDFTESGIKKRPSFIGNITNKYIYEMLPKGTVILEKLKQKTPKTEAGHYKVKLHQSLTPDIGREHLKRQILEVTTLMSVSRNWNEFQELFSRRFGQIAIDFDIKEEPVLVKPISNFDKNLKGLLSVPPPQKEKGNKNERETN